MGTLLPLVMALLVLPGTQAALLQAGDDGTPALHDLIVLLQPSEGKRDAAAAAARVMELAPGAIPLTLLPGFVLLDAPAALEHELRALPGVERVDRARPLELHTHLSLRLTRADAGPRGLADHGFTGAGTTVAVVDSGIDATHPDLRGRVAANVKLLEGRFLDAPGDPRGHGTHVAGIVAADGASGGHRGVAPGARLVGLDITERFTTASAMLAYDWLFVNREAHGIDVVVNAWGRTTREAFDASDPVIRGIDRLVDAGVVVLFSTSNHGPSPLSLSAEAQNPRVVTVGATDDAGLLQDYSSRGPSTVLGAIKPDVVAPGERIVSLRSLQAPHDPDTDPDALHRELSGTSQSVPHVAGIVALMLEANPAMSPTAVLNALREAAIDLGAPGPDHASGFGLADARDSVRIAQGSAPDRRNILIVGGRETYEDDARLTPGASGGIFGFLQPDEDLWTTRFPVKPGAGRLDLQLTWPEAAAAPLSASLDKDGQPMGTWTRSETRDGRATLEGTLDAPMPGVWTLRVRGATPVALDVASRIDVTLAPNATRATGFDETHRLPEESRGLEPLRHGLQVLWIQTLLHARANPWLLPAIAAGCLLILPLLALLTRPKRSRAPPAQDDETTRARP